MSFKLSKKKLFNHLDNLINITDYNDSFLFNKRITTGISENPQVEPFMEEWVEKWNKINAPWKVTLRKTEGEYYFQANKLPRFKRVPKLIKDEKIEIQTSDYIQQVALIDRDTDENTDNYWAYEKEDVLECYVLTR